MHFHLADGDDEHNQPHAHTHAYGSVNADHFTTEHDGEVSGDIGSALTKKSFAYDLFVIAFIVLVAIVLAHQRTWHAVHNIRPRYQLLFFRPPLRAPPV